MISSIHLCQYCSLSPMPVMLLKSIYACCKVGNTFLYHNCVRKLCECCTIRPIQEPRFLISCHELVVVGVGSVSSGKLNLVVNKEAETGNQKEMTCNKETMRGSIVVDNVHGVLAKREWRVVKCFQVSKGCCCEERAVVDCQRLA